MQLHKKIIVSSCYFNNCFNDFSSGRIPLYFEGSAFVVLYVATPIALLKSRKEYSTTLSVLLLHRMIPIEVFSCGCLTISSNAERYRFIFPRYSGLNFPFFNSNATRLCNLRLKNNKSTKNSSSSTTKRY